MSDFKDIDDFLKEAKKWIGELFTGEGLFSEFDFEGENPSSDNGNKEHEHENINPKIPWELLPLPVKDDIEEAVLWPIIKKEIAKEYNIRPSKGILLFGPPGCGKTLLMKALAKRFIDNNICAYIIHLSDILSKWYGESEQKIKAVFDKALKCPPGFIFIDEFETIGRKRESYNTDDVTPRLLSMFLSLLDGMSAGGDVGIIASTNRVEFIDDAMLRPGRFDKVIYIPPPDFHLRKEIFKIHSTGRKTEKINFEYLAEISDRYSGADISLIWEEASRIAMRRAIKEGISSPITTKDLEYVMEGLNPSIADEDLIKYSEMKKRFNRFN
jgi:SpoVK/Ycf46/Vps4 family AAA+-type ATPase